MNKRILAIVAVVIIAGGIIYALTANNKTNDTNTANTNSNTPAQSQTNNTQKSQSVNSSAVSIQGFAFTPGDISVKKGTAVTWTNNDSTAHTVTETDSQTGPRSGNLSPGDKYSFTFNTTGTFHYRCDIHPSMVGTVTVTE